MKQPKNRRPLFWRLMVWIILFWFGLLSVTTLLTIAHTSRTFAGKVDEILYSTVKSLAETRSVVEMVERGQCSPELIDFLNAVVENTEDLDYVTIADANSVRLYHPDPEWIGRPFEGGDQERALAGAHYFSDAKPAHFERQRRAFYPVERADGTVIGFVMASTTHARLAQIQARVYDTYGKLFLLLTGLTALVSLPMAMYLGRNLRGVRPEDLLRVYLTQNDILNALDEGLISYDNRGQVRMVNTAAARMLGRREEELLGRQVDDLIRVADGSSLRSRDRHLLQSDRPNILVKPVRLPDSNLWARRVLILADKSDIARYNEELGGTRHMVNTLRATTHEFHNKLQVISGLLQMERHQEARDYIGNLSDNHERIVSPVMKLIRNSNLAALILGKASSMRELDIELTLLRNSHLPEQSRFLGTGELVTVVGNLLENAMEAVNAAPADGIRSVTLQISEDDRGLLIQVSDTGVGMGTDVLPHLFENGFSTKASTGRGTGMGLIQSIADRFGGTIEVETEPGSGTTMTMIFSRERGANL